MQARTDGGVPRDLPTGVAPTLVRSVEDRRTPYRVLAGLLVMAAVVSLLFGVARSSSQDIRDSGLVAAVVLVLAALLVRTVGDRIPGGLALDLGIGLGVLVGCLGVAAVPTASGQLLIGSGLVLFGVYLAYFRSLGRALGLLVVMLVGYVAALLHNPQLNQPTDGVISCVVIAGVTVMVARLVARLRALSQCDSLTGALNRRGLDLVADPLAGASARGGWPITVGLIDIDSFKTYNDTHGHLAGDAALVALVDAWRGELRASDILARYGGDEFALVLPGTRSDDAEELAVRLAARSTLSWTVGFVEWTPQEDLYAALARADTLMFERKTRRG